MGKKLLKGVGILLLCLLAGASTYFLLFGIHLEAKPGDLEVVLTAEELAPLLEDFHPDPSRSKLSRTFYLDGSLDIDYEYEDDTTYLSCTFGQERTVKDARQTYALVAAVQGYTLGEDLQEVEGFEWGDQSTGYVILSGETPVGNIFAARKDKRVYHIVMGGLHFPADSDFVTEVLIPDLEAAQAYEM